MCNVSACCGAAAWQQHDGAAAASAQLLVPVKSFPSDFWHSGPVTVETMGFIAHWLAQTSRMRGSEG